MKLPELQNPERYTGLYIIDFGDHTGVGFRAEEVTALLEEDPTQDIRIYKIYRAQPDGTMDLRGVDPSIFHLEAGMFFYADNIDTARGEYETLIRLAQETAPPSRARISLAALDEDRWVIALIYPAEYDDQVSRWLLDVGYKTAGLVEGGISAVNRYYDRDVRVLESRQLFPERQQILAGEELRQAARRALVR